MKSFSILLILIPFCSFSQNSEKVELKTYSRDNISLTYPSHWELNESGAMGTKLILFSPLESAEDNFRENVNLIIQDLSGYNLNLAAYTKISVDQIPTVVTNYKLIESKTISINNEPVHKLVYDGDQGIYHLRFEQYFCIKDNHAYVLTFTTKQDTYSSFKETGEKILNSMMVGDLN
jgi:hypothetical protein